MASSSVCSIPINILPCAEIPRSVLGGGHCYFPFKNDQFTQSEYPGLLDRDFVAN
jgi:hypothetical protein